MAARAEYWNEGDAKQFLSSLSKELQFANLMADTKSENYPANLRNLLQQKKIRRTRTLDGVIRVDNRVSYSFHTVVVIVKSKLRGTSTPTSIHLILKHTASIDEIVFYYQRYQQSK